MTIADEARRVPTKELCMLQGHSLPVSAITFNPKGSHLASCSADKSIRVWSVEDKACARTLEGHTRGISDVAWHPTSQYLASAADDLTLGIWDTETGTRLRKMSGHGHFVYCCKFHQDGNVVVSGSLDEAVRFWDLRTGQSVKAIPAHSDPVTSLDFIWDGTVLASASSDGLCRLWDFGTGLCLRTLMDNNTPPVSNIRFSPNGRFVLESVLNHTLRLWDWRRDCGRVVRRFSGHVNSMYCLPAFFLRGSCIASASEDGTVAVWDINSKQVVKHNVNTLPERPAELAVNAEVSTEKEVKVEVEPASLPAQKDEAKVLNPETPIAMDIHEGAELMATSQIGHPQNAIRLAVLPPAPS